MTSTGLEWLKAALFCLAVGGLWGCWREFADSKRAGLDGRAQTFRPGRATIKGLAAAGAALAGLVLLTQAGLTELPRLF